MIHHMVNITTTEAKLFAIRCGINQAISIPNIKCIVVVTNSLHTAKKIFDTSTHPYQIHSNVISWELRDFFKKDSNNHIEFWDCPSKQKWTPHFLVGKDTRRFNFFSHSLKKIILGFLQKVWMWLYFCDVEDDFPSIRSKRKKFLKLLDNDLNPLEPSTVKGGPWLQYFSHSNSLCTRAIVNHAPIGEYQLRFFPREEFACSCGIYPIESRHHILHECKRFNNYWNPRRDSIGHFSQFLIFNSKAFSFKDSVASLNC